LLICVLLSLVDQEQCARQPASPARRRYGTSDDERRDHGGTVDAPQG
jgi:hypothetical protein